MNNNKKVILINGDKSKWYEQAIFIINEKEENVPKNIVFEAEKIINEYVNKKYNKNISGSNSFEIHKNNFSNFQNNSKSISSNKYMNKSKKNIQKNKQLNSYLNIMIFLTVCTIAILSYIIWF